MDSLRLLQSSLDSITKGMKDDDFKITKLFYPDENKFKLMKQKGIFPYDYIDSHDRFLETQLPPIEKFYSILSQRNISEEDYNHAVNVCREFNIQNLGEYNDLYLLTDVLLLADVMENFRLKFDLDPTHYMTAPSLSWDLLLYNSQTNLELLTDYEMVLLIENNIRGGISSIMGTRIVKANNKDTNYK